MKFEDYKSGQYKKQYQYESFTPSVINCEWSWDDTSINTLLEKAYNSLAQLDAYSHIVPDVDIFINMHMNLEANKSSRIEGTQTNIDEAVMKMELIEPEKRDDWQEVQNYIKAMNHSIMSLGEIPLSMRLLRDTHKTLMSGVRGEHKLPGEIRKSQNWIGGSSLADAVFIPPHHNEISDLLTDMEKFWHNDEIHVPHLVRIAISHYQFETIHPFLDGNGRIGRLLITLYLLNCGMLQKPVLYLSDYFEKRRGSYYDALTAVRSSNNIAHWVKFFLVAVAETAEKGKLTFTKIMEMKNELDCWVYSLGRKAENANKLLTDMYSNPVINSESVGELLELTPKSSLALIDDFVQEGILKELTGFKRNRVYIFDRYMQLFRD